MRSIFKHGFILLFSCTVFLVAVSGCSPTQIKTYGGPLKPIKQVSIIYAPTPLAPVGINGTPAMKNNLFMTEGGFLETLPGDCTLDLLLHFKARNATAVKKLPQIKFKAKANHLYYYMPILKASNTRAYLYREIPMSYDWPNGYSYSFKRIEDGYNLLVFNPKKNEWFEPKHSSKVKYFLHYWQFSQDKSSLAYSYADKNSPLNIILNGKLIYQDAGKGAVASSAAFSKDLKHFAYIKIVDKRNMLVVDGNYYLLPKALQDKQLPYGLFAYEFVDPEHKFRRGAILANDTFTEFKIYRYKPKCPYRMTDNKGRWIEYKYPCKFVSIKLSELKKL